MIPMLSRTRPKTRNDAACSMMRRRPVACMSLLLLGVALSIGMVRAEERKDREFKECADCPVMVGIPAGFP